jgi:hypothetical protein
MTKKETRKAISDAVNQFDFNYMNNYSLLNKSQQLLVRNQTEWLMQYRDTTTICDVIIERVERLIKSLRS